MNRVQIIEEWGNSFLAYMTCTFCQSSIMVRVMSMPQGLVGSAILTELSPEEITKFSEQEGINANDVLRVYEVNQSSGLLKEIIKNNN
ncbi:MAG: hypothetical protein NUV82_01895 [Candidatus Komeilibacteria bacterium]|nr:hypothetical protein [Candidatus Komeilibacteria bacterium]